jgi:murein DD-endopeptidase MepM/ murein hydrolase activator NlpD
MRRYLTLKIVPHERGGPRSVRIPYAAGALGLGLIVAAAGGVLLVGYLTADDEAPQRDPLEADGSRIRAMHGKLNELARNLESSERVYRDIRVLTGRRSSPPRPPGPRAASAGEPRTAGSAIDPRPFGDEERRLLARALNSVPRLWPLTRKGIVRRDFSARDGHKALDIAVESNTPVLATADGIVVAAGLDSVYGNYVVIQHDASTTSVYGQNALNFVAEGDLVRRGDIIAQSGNSGRSTVPHLHFEIRKNGLQVDPRRYLRR